MYFDDKMVMTVYVWHEISSTHEDNYKVEYTDTSLCMYTMFAWEYLANNTDISAFNSLHMII